MQSDLLPAALPCDSAMLQITLKNQLTSPLLRLPAEIRNKIYIYVSLSTKIKVTGAYDRDQNSHNPYLSTPGFVRSCKQIQHEATTLLYNLATFDFTKHGRALLPDRGFNCNIGGLITSIRMRGRLARALMSRSTQELGSSGPPAGDLPSLERVHVQRVYRGWQTVKDPAALRKWFQNESLEIIFEKSWLE